MFFPNVSSFQQCRAEHQWHRPQRETMLNPFQVLDRASQAKAPGSYRSTSSLHRCLLSRYQAVIRLERSLKNVVLIPIATSPAMQTNTPRRPPARWASALHCVRLHVPLSSIIYIHRKIIHLLPPQCPSKKSCRRSSSRSHKQFLRRSRPSSTILC